MMRLKVALTTALLLQVFWTPSAEGGRILVLFPAAIKSHFILGNALVEELVNRGHDVTFVSSFGSKLDNKNVKDIVINGIVEGMEEFQKEMFTFDKKSIVGQMNHVMTMTDWMTNASLNDTKVAELLTSNEKFDLVIMEALMNEAQVVFAHHFDAPLIIVSSVGSNPDVNHFVGNEAPSSYCPQMMTGVTGQMNFIQRTQNFFNTIIINLIFTFIQIPQQEAIKNKYFRDAPPIKQIIKERVALMLLNSHPAINTAKPSVPNMIEIGGFHIADVKPLPTELKTYLDNAKQGFILFSLGSNIKSKTLPVKTREVIMEVLTQLPYKILWKFEDDQLPGKPDNVKIDKWLPQNDILAHPNLKLFITHGGLSSTIEAVHHGVPIVGIPVFGDQKVNMASAENLGIGKAIDFNELNYEKLLATVQEVVNNKAYREAARHRSALFRDQPVRPIDSAMYWIEYVLRHKYSEHLKTGAIHLNWFQINSIDVLAFVGSILFTVVYIFYFLVKKCCCCRKSKTYSQEKSKVKRYSQEKLKKKKKNQ